MKYILIAAAMFAAGAVMVYGWRLNKRTYPVAYGVHFSAAHAAWLGLDPEETYRAILTELKPRYLRLAVNWNEVEKEKGVWDFTPVDRQMNEALRHNARVVLVVGQKTPHWPECHTPPWVSSDSEKRKEEVLTYIRMTVERYRSHGALEFWQVENEPFILFSFGDCKQFAHAWTADEVALVRSLDPAHKIMVTDSGELGTWWRAARTGDYFGTTVYRTVRTLKGHVATYDMLPPAYYTLKAKLLGKGLANFFVSELQAEPWFTDTPPWESPIEEQEETFNPSRFRDNLAFVQHIGASRAYLWGAEWWYWMKTKKDDDRYWDIAKEAFDAVQ